MIPAQDLTGPGSRRKAAPAPRTSNMATEAEARWLVAVDRDTGDMYYFNQATDETLWELPAGVYPSGLAVLRGEMDDELRREWLRARADSFAPIEA